jgi:hypothetical protein
MSDSSGSDRERLFSIHVGRTEAVEEAYLEVAADNPPIGTVPLHLAPFELYPLKARGKLRGLLPLTRSLLGSDIDWNAGALSFNGVIFRPWTSPSRETLPAAMSAQEVDEFRQAVRNIWEHLRVNLTSSLHSGTFVMFARPGHRLASFRRIPTDAWASFPIHNWDWEHGAAVAEDRDSNVRADDRSAEERDRTFDQATGAPRRPSSIWHNTGRVRRTAQTSAIQDAADRLYPDGRVPTPGELSNQRLIGAIRDECARNKSIAPHGNTILDIMGRTSRRPHKHK